MCGYGHDCTAPSQSGQSCGLAATLGIAAGQPFTPDETLTAILDASAAVGDKYATTVAFNPGDHLRVWPDRHWTSNMIPGPYVTADPEFNAPAYQDFDERLSCFYSAFSEPMRKMPGVLIKGRDLKQAVATVS